MDRRQLLASGISLIAFPGAASALTRSARPVKRPADLPRSSDVSASGIVAQAKLPGETSFTLLNIDTGEIEGSHAPELRLPPASVVKAVTAVFALEKLGSDFRFATHLGFNGQMRNGVLDGDLILIGGGDPTLDTDGLARLAQRAKDAGLREVRGALLYWSGALPRVDRIDPTQPEHLGYNPTITGLNLNFNRVHFEWNAAQNDVAVTMQARSQRYRPAVQVARMSIATRNAPVYTYEEGAGFDQWTVARSALGAEGSRWLPVRFPAKYAAEVLETFLSAQGIRVARRNETENPGAWNELARVESEPLSVLCRDMLKFSTNLTAECLGLRASRSGTLRDSGDAMATWAKATLGLRHIACWDHSGLGDQSRISSIDLARFFASPTVETRIRPLLSEHSATYTTTAGGSEKGPQIYAKTGTLNFVSGLGGYVEAADGARFAFGVLNAHLERRSQLTRAQMERPDGGRSWVRRARNLQSQLITRLI